MSKRKSLSKRLRFEVFKRDNFTCQYCGAKAPDVILHVDHINPVAKGGDNDILNLITSCSDCNGGKGARRLDDNHELDRQRRQLEELNERRQQLEWMLEWRRELSRFEDGLLDKAVEYFNEKVSPHSVTNHGRSLFAKWFQKYGLETLLIAIDDATKQFVRRMPDGSLDLDSVNEAFNMVPRIAGGKRLEAEKPWMKDAFYIRAILRNRLPRLNEGAALRLIEAALTKYGIEADLLKQVAKEVRSWTHFQDVLQEWFAEIDEWDRDRGQE